MLAAVMLINRTGAMVLPFLAIYMHESLHFSIYETGIVLSFFGLGSLLGNITGGWLTDRFGNFRVQCFSLFAAVPFYILLSRLETLTALTIGVCCLSFITDLFRPANAAAITHYARPENITRAFSLNRMAINLGFSFGPSLGGLLAARSYDLLFWGNAFGSLIAGLLFYSYFKDVRPRENAKVTAKIADRKKLGPTAYQDKPYLLFAFISLLYFIPFCQLLNAIPLYLDNKVHLTKTAIGLLMGYSGFIIVLTEMVLVSFAEKRFPIYTTLMWGSFFCIPAFILFSLNPALWVLYLAISLISLSEILVLPFMSTVGALRASGHNKGSYMALNSLGFSAAFIITPFLSTTIIEHWGYKVLWMADILLILAALAGLQLLKRKMPLRLPVQGDTQG
ncbi:MFS transporter [Niabella terrae]